MLNKGGVLLEKPVGVLTAQCSPAAKPAEFNHWIWMSSQHLRSCGENVGQYV